MMTDYKTGDYVKRGTQVFKILNVFHGDGENILHIFGPLNAVRFQVGEFVSTSTEVIQPATAVEYINYCRELREIVKHKLAVLIEDEI